MNPEYVFDLVKQFFEGSQGSGGKAAGSPTQAATHNLLRLACMGNAEKTIQGELLHFLRLNRIEAVSENGYRVIRNGLPPADRHIDIMVFDGNEPLVAIELKHYSPHQGSVGPLCKKLDEDYAKCKGANAPAPLPDRVKLIQVGLFTEINEIKPWPAPKNIDHFAFYRFLSAYVLKSGTAVPLTPVVTAPSQSLRLATHQKTFTTWLSKVAPSKRYGSSPNDLKHGTYEIFQIPSSSGPNPYKVDGWVHWFVGMA